MRTAWRTGIRALFEWCPFINNVEYLIHCLDYLWSWMRYILVKQAISGLRFKAIKLSA